ncbi:hypothetical protein GCM10008904_14740 [Paraclostridium ghonii]|uniref:ABC-type sugar transport system substrate-binding protein n=1 Tax=Paraclostridium ghonii TaxID=29358 RepID=A0ABU0MZR2_9FIRM|nr:sugar ABC transporter substrate-binding protein [Paeniclostridium ghonii]MDQ0556408.1 ABC-type sugar transport system substrate-binding protein [Paeniclostridium ghonii]
MKRTYKLSTLILILLITTITYGCSKNVSVSNSQNEYIEQPTKDVRKIAFAHKSINSFFYITMNESIKRAVKEKGWEFEYAVADYDYVRQNNQIINFIGKKPDAIITTAINSTQINDSINIAKNEGIPVAIVDTDTSGSKVDIVVSFDNYLAGQQAAKEIVNRLKDKYGYEKGVVFNAYGLESSKADIDRKKGFESIINRYEDIVYIEKPGYSNPEDVKNTLLEAYEENSNIDAVFCSSDYPARGMVDALKELNKWEVVGQKEHVIFVTIDGEPSAIDNIKKGYYDASVVQDVVSYGNIVIDLIDRYIFKGEKLDSKTYTCENAYWEKCSIQQHNDGIKVIIPLYVVDKSNVEDKRHWAYIAQEKWGFRYK